LFTELLVVEKLLAFVELGAARKTGMGLGEDGGEGVGSRDTCNVLVGESIVIEVVGPWLTGLLLVEERHLA